MWIHSVSAAPLWQIRQIDQYCRFYSLSAILVCILWRREVYLHCELWFYSDGDMLLTLMVSRWIFFQAQLTIALYFKIKLSDHSTPHPHIVKAYLYAWSALAFTIDPNSFAFPELASSSLYLISSSAASFSVSLLQRCCLADWPSWNECLNLPLYQLPIEFVFVGCNLCVFQSTLQIQGKWEVAFSHLLHNRPTFEVLSLCR